MSARHGARYLSWRFDASKVPDVSAGFWLIKLLTTGMGEATSDYFVHRVNPVLAVLSTGVVFVASLVYQLATSRYRTYPYWFAIVMVSVFGTMCADVVHVGFGVPYAVSSAAFAVVLVVVFATWRSVEGTLSIHSITTSRRELFYWASVTVTFALGTAVGDNSAATLGWGYLDSGLIFSALFLLVAAQFAWRRRAPIASFWCAYVLTRPLGASFADWLGRPPSFGGRGWGPGTVALESSLCIVAGVVWLRRRERRRETEQSLG